VGGRAEEPRGAAMRLAMHPPAFEKVTFQRSLGVSAGKRIPARVNTTPSRSARSRPAVILGSLLKM
jgi:hypothetical protein